MVATLLYIRTPLVPIQEQSNEAIDKLFLYFNKNMEDYETTETV